MIQRQLTDLLNSGEAVAVVGSGISVDAGIPTWRSLFNSIADALDEEGQVTKKAREVAGRGKLPEAFDHLSRQVGTTNLHAKISEVTGQGTPGKLHHQLADWPFRFYITTNFDHLIEDAPTGRRLTPVGNRGPELHKVAGGNRDFVWHLHGGCRMGPESSRLVVTNADYTEFYPNSNLAERLKAIATIHQCVFLGFGFGDEDLIHVLRAVGRLADPARPSFAFLGFPAGSGDVHECQDSFRSDYNIEIIPYFMSGEGHQNLHRVLEGYSSFVVRRSISFGTSTRSSPSYHSVASSLNIQRSLDIGLSATSASLRQTLIGARVLAFVRENPCGEDMGLDQIYRSGTPSREEVIGCVRSFREAGILTPSPALEITPEYWAKIDETTAQLDLTTVRFRTSLRERVLGRSPDLAESAQERVIGIGLRYLDELCRARGLGVAQNLATSNTEEAGRRTVSLVQHLPEHLVECTHQDEALCLVNVVQDILTRPTDGEAEFLGILCQAYFGQHLAGASETLAQVDLDFISGTCFVLDASILVCLLAEGSEGHEFTKSLIEDLLAHGGVLTTTGLFLEETAEHARWAADLVNRHGEESTEVLDALRGKGTYRGNEFLSGYFVGSTPGLRFDDYLRRVLSMEKNGRIKSEVIGVRLKAMGIQAVDFDGWDGFQEEDHTRLEEVQQEIVRRRSERGTFRHDRQTRAEAEVAIIVHGLQRGELRPPGHSAGDAFFVSSTRVVDQLPDLEGRICLLPEGLAQWLWSARSTSPRHSELVFEHLLWELAQKGIEFVDRETLLRRFSGVIEAAEADLQALTSSRREYLVERYGPDPAEAFGEVDPLDLPRLQDEAYKEALRGAEERLRAAEEREVEARAAAKVSEGELKELEEFREKQKSRRRRAQREQRAARSRAEKRRGRRKKKKKKKKKRGST